MRYVIANWKCNPATVGEAKKILAGYAKLLKKSKKSTTVVCPPACYLPLVKEAIKGKAVLGGQNCHWEAGAYTGEINPAQLAGLGCDYVIVGHSERRQKFNENNETVNKKLKAVLAAGLTPVLCVGETREERIDGKITEIVEAQIKEGLADIDINAQKPIIAYEPVWAIGTGQACSPQEADVVRQFIRNITNEGIPLLYGGSAKSNNCASYIGQSGFDGLLVGGASLDAKEFALIAQTVTAA